MKVENRLYFFDNYLKKFSGKVASVKNVDSKLKIILDKTAFRPATGGQDCDFGIIFSKGFKLKVEKVIKRNSDIVHVGSEFYGSIKENDVVQGEIDWDRRILLMKTHSGQHIFARSLEIVFEKIDKKVNFNKVHIHEGFGDLILDQIGLDLNLIFEAEEMTNRIILENRKITTTVVKNLDEFTKTFTKFRSNVNKIKNQTPIRGISVDDFDVSTCTGSHVSNTKEINFFKILGIKTQKKETKIEFAVDSTALTTLSKIYNKLLPVTHDFSLSIENIHQKITHMNEEFKNLRKEKENLKSNLIILLSKEIIKQENKISKLNLFELILNDVDIQFLQRLSQIIFETKKKPSIAILSTMDQEKTSVLIETNFPDIQLNRILDRASLRFKGNVNQNKAIMIFNNDIKINKRIEALKNNLFEKIKNR
ncbi:MAG: alanine--tRNA ligase-related protein [Candidatus Ranarchaeia archaeon]